MAPRTGDRRGGIESIRSSAQRSPSMTSSGAQRSFCHAPLQETFAGCSD